MAETLRYRQERIEDKQGEVSILTVTNDGSFDYREPLTFEQATFGTLLTEDAANDPTNLSLVGSSSGSLDY